MEVHKHAVLIPLSEEALRDVQETSAAWDRYMNATDAEREQWAREAAERRAAERTSAHRMPLDLDALLDKLDWSPEYATHLVQPYCTCGDSSDGWDYCQHARDEGLIP